MFFKEFVDDDTSHGQPEDGGNKGNAAQDYAAVVAAEDLIFTIGANTVGAAKTGLRVELAVLLGGIDNVDTAGDIGLF